MEPGRDKLPSSILTNQGSKAADERKSQRPPPKPPNKEHGTRQENIEKLRLD